MMDILSWSQKYKTQNILFVFLLPSQEVLRPPEYSTTEILRLKKYVYRKP